MILRAGLIGDVHGQLEPLRAAVALLQSQADLDALLCTGDIPERGDPLLTEKSVECIRLLQEAKVQTVRGNHDRWKLDILKDESPRPLVPGWSEDEVLSSVFNSARHASRTFCASARASSFLPSSSASVAALMPE